jgi:hypothetical protein
MSCDTSAILWTIKGVQSYVDIFETTVGTTESIHSK